MITEVIVAGGLVTIMLCLFHVNNNRIHKNEKDIEDCEKFLYKLDKKIDILVTTLEIKYPSAMKRAKKQNGE